MPTTTPKAAKTPRGEHSSAGRGAACITPDQARRVVTHLLNDNCSYREAYTRVFGPDRRNRTPRYLFQALRDYGFLRMEDDSELSGTFQDRAAPIRCVRVLDVDTTTENGRASFSRASAEFFLEALRDLRGVLHPTQAKQMYVALGGGESTALMLNGISGALRNALWFPAIRHLIHLRTVTAGHQKEHQIPLVHLMRCRQALLEIDSDVQEYNTRIECKRARLLWLPSVDDSHRRKAQIAHLQQDINLVFTGCAGAGDFCPEAIRQATPARQLPANWAGEILFSFYNNDGQHIPHDGAVVTAFPGDFVPKRIVNKDGGHFFLVASVFHSNAAQLEGKARALRGAVLGTHKWITHLICCSAVARRALELAG